MRPRDAATLIIIRDDREVLLGVRTAHHVFMPHCYVFPGGRVDPGESVEQAALRELEEEVDLRLDSGSVLGRLDDYATRSGYVITPVVVWGGSNVELTPNPGEVDLVHRIPLNELMRDDAPILESIAGSEHPVLKCRSATNGLPPPVLLSPTSFAR